MHSTLEFQNKEAFLKKQVQLNDTNLHRVSFVKKNAEFLQPLLDHTNLPKSLVTIIHEYTFQTRKVKWRMEYDSTCSIITKDNLSVTIELTQFYPKFMLYVTDFHKNILKVQGIAEYDDENEIDPNRPHERDEKEPCPRTLKSRLLECFRQCQMKTDGKFTNIEFYFS